VMRWQGRKKGSVTHILLVMVKYDEMACQKKRIVSLTRCWSWDEM
jgi:hypothetical protein